MYLVLRAELEASFNAGLLANAEHAAGAFAQDTDASGRLRPTERLIAQFASTGGRVVVLDAGGAELADSAPAGSPALSIGPEDLAAADRHAHAIREFAASGDVLRLTVEPVNLLDGSRVGYVAWADSTRPLRDLLTTVSVALVFGGAAVIGLALVGGLVLARRALAPVSDVTETARAISLSGDFAARVEAGRPGDEVGELAVAFNEMLAALEQNHQALQRFLGDASHQLRTPLTTIRANLDLAGTVGPARRGAGGDPGRCARRGRADGQADRRSPVARPGGVRALDSNSVPSSSTPCWSSPSGASARRRRTSG